MLSFDASYKHTHLISRDHNPLQLYKLGFIIDLVCNFTNLSSLFIQNKPSLAPPTSLGTFFIQETCKYLKL